MSMRISRPAFGIALLLVACAPESGAPQGTNVECALGDNASFSADCVLEHGQGGVFTIHHSDGTFQRVRYDDAAGMLTVADGAETMKAKPDPSAAVLEFTVGAARYRIPRDALTAASP